MGLEFRDAGVGLLAGLAQRRVSLILQGLDAALQFLVPGLRGLQFVLQCGLLLHLGLGLLVRFGQLGLEFRDAGIGLFAGMGQRGIGFVL